MRQSFNQMIRQDYEWWKKQSPNSMFLEDYSEEERFEYYLDEVINNKDGISNNIRTNCVIAAIRDIKLEDI